MVALFLSALALVLYSYAGYPLICFLRARLLPMSLARRSVKPQVTVIIAAYRETETIARKLDDLRAQTYPQNLTEVVVACDGAEDDTAARARQAAAAWGDRCKVLELARAGKPAALNQAVAVAQGEILIFTDARQPLSKNAIKALVKGLADETVGAVSGQLVLEGDAPVGAYWRYEAAIRRWEGQSGSTIGVSGALYALRKSLFSPLPAETVLDDLLVPMRVRLSGRRVAFEPAAQAFDRAEKSDREFFRKVRTLAGNFQLLLLAPELFFPWRNPSWFDFCSHKLSRLFVPYALVGLFLSSLALPHPLGPLLFFCQVIAYAVALLRLCNLLPAWRIFGLAETLVVLNAAAVVALGRFIRHGRNIPWK